MVTACSSTTWVLPETFGDQAEQHTFTLPSKGSDTCTSVVCVFLDGKDNKTTGESIIQAQFLYLMLRIKWLGLLQRLLTGNNPLPQIILLPT